MLLVDDRDGEVFRVLDRELVHTAVLRVRLELRNLRTWKVEFRGFPFEHLLEPPMLPVREAIYLDASDTGDVFLDAGAPAEYIMPREEGHGLDLAPGDHVALLFLEGRPVEAARMPEPGRGG